jgi:predicted CoA-substrate-specific enzyme activase
VKNASESAFDECLKEMKITKEDVSRIIATGYGRKFVEFSTRDVTEISCYAKGANFLNNDVRTVIDIGGQDSKVIAVSHTGDVDDFVMNDKCAAGTGRFLEMVARSFDMKLDEMGPLALETENVTEISSICAVFAESEVISLFSRGVSKAEILNSIHHSLAKRVRGMANRITVTPKIMFCGGVAANTGMVESMKRIFEIDELVIPENVDIVGALGAALFDL